jgi:hypothetical protein
MADKPWVYIASPYTKGDVAINVRSQLVAFDSLMNMGVIPVAPLCSHFQHLFSPRPYQDWIDLDIEIVKRCDACLRLSANCWMADGTQYVQTESSGADGEVEAFRKMGKPVFFGIGPLEQWLAAREREEG